MTGSLSRLIRFLIGEHQLIISTVYGRCGIMGISSTRLTSWPCDDKTRAIIRGSVRRLPQCSKLLLWPGCVSNLYTRLCYCLSSCLCPCLSVYNSLSVVRVFLKVSMALYVYLPACRFLPVCVCSSVFLFVFLRVCVSMSVCLPVSISLPGSISLSVSLFLFLGADLRVFTMVFECDSKLLGETHSQIRIHFFNIFNTEELFLDNVDSDTFVITVILYRLFVLSDFEYDILLFYICFAF